MAGRGVAEKRFNQVYVVLKVEKVTHTSDATLHVNGGEIHASAEGQDMYAAIDGLIDKLARQLNGGWFRGDEPDCRADDWRHDHRTFAVAVYYPGGV